MHRRLQLQLLRGDLHRAAHHLSARCAAGGDASPAPRQAHALRWRRQVAFTRPAITYDAGRRCRLAHDEHLKSTCHALLRSPKPLSPRYSHHMTLIYEVIDRTQATTSIITLHVRPRLTSRTNARDATHLHASLTLTTHTTLGSCAASVDTHQLPCTHAPEAAVRMRTGAVAHTCHSARWYRASTHEP